MFHWIFLFSLNFKAKKKKIKHAFEYQAMGEMLRGSLADDTAFEASWQSCTAGLTTGPDTPPAAGSEAPHGDVSPPQHNIRGGRVGPGRPVLGVCRCVCSTVFPCCVCACECVCVRGACHSECSVVLTNSEPSCPPSSSFPRCFMRLT